MDFAKKRAELTQAREQMLANLHAITGALQLLDEIEKEATATPLKDPDAHDAA